MCIRDSRGSLHDFFQMVGLKVADADGLDFSLVIQLLKGFPGFAVVFNIVFLLVFGNGPMNQIKVQIVQAEPLQRFLEGFFRFFIAVVVIPQLADHSDLPVSYTHLDVYKRQGVEWEEMLREAADQAVMTKIGYAKE